MEYSVKFVLFNLSGLNVKVIGFRVKFVEVCESFDECDRLKITFQTLFYNNFQIFVINYFCKNNLKSHIFISF